MNYEAFNKKQQKTTTRGQQGMNKVTDIINEGLVGKKCIQEMSL